MSKHEKAILKYIKEIEIHDYKIQTQSYFLSKLSYSTRKYLTILSFSEHNTISDIAKMLGLTKAAVTLKMNELEKQGLIIREQSEKDKRVYYIRVPQIVKDAWEESDAIFEKITSKCEKKFSDTELNCFFKVLSFFTKELEKENDNLKLEKEESNNEQ